VTGAGALVVGASLAGATVAVSLRDAGFLGPVTLLGAEDELPYERPALSKGYLAGTATAEDLLVHPADHYRARGVALRLGEIATGLDPGRRLVRTDRGREVPYDVLVVATGARNVRPPVPGLDLAGVHQLRTRRDADGLRAALPGAARAVVVGMGFIGCEVAATLRGLGLAVTAVDALPGPLWGALGPQLSAVARRWHEDHGVRVLPDRSVAALVPDAAGRAVRGVVLADGEHLPADLVVVGVGARPETGWLADAPVHLVGGAVGVDAEGRTDLPGVWAVGDVAAPWDARAQVHRRREHWSSAVDQGRRAAQAIAGVPVDPPELPYVWSDQYDHTLQYAGDREPGDRAVVRGDLGDGGPVTVFWQREDTVTAVLSVDDGRQFLRGRRLLHRAVDPAALVDPSVDLRHVPERTPVS
jgi:3-phenylpropionate/trans-cinnamate dioxygenase ferredoxin reductase subunit